MNSTLRKAGVAGTVALGTLMVPAVASAETAPASPDFGPSITAAKDEGLGILTDNVLLLLALPVAWVGYKVARKVIGKIG
jgi:hypothetical protein